MKARIRAAIAKNDFRSHSGIACFAKVSSEEYSVYLRVLNVRIALLDNLYICDACDADGVPDLMRSSGKHTEEHHLIRCLAPEKTDVNDKAAATEQRLTSIESRLDGLQTQLDGLTDCMGDLTGRMGDLSGRTGDLTGHMGDLTGRTGDLTGRMDDLTGRIGDLTGYIGDLNARMGNIEQLLQRLVGTPDGRTA